MNAAMIKQISVRPHPVDARYDHTLAATRTETRGAAAWNAAPRPRCCGNTTLRSMVPFAPERLLQLRARRFAALDARLRHMAPLYRRRDMLGALLRHALLRANTAEIIVSDHVVASVALVAQEDGTAKIVVRLRRGRKPKETVS